MELNWNDVLAEVSKKIPSMYYDPFIQPLTIKEFDRNEIFLHAPSTTIKEHVEKKYQQYIQDAIEKISGSRLKISISADVQSINPISNFVENRFNETQSVFHPDYSFENTLKGDSNALAITAAMEVVQKPGIFNPLYIYGRVGVGKTHLLQAIGKALQEKNENVKYLSISQFLTEFVYNLQIKNGLDQFRSRFQSYTCLIIDDIHQLNSTAEKTQEEFFQLYNFLFERNRQIIISADRPVHELPLQDRLRSRFLSGYQVEIKPPDSKIREMLIQKKSEDFSLNLSDTSIQFIQDNFKSDMRSITGCLNELSLYRKTYNLLLFSDEKVKEILESRIEKIGKIDIQHDRILDTVCEYYSQEKSQITSKSRKSEYIIPRHVSMYLIYEICNLNKTMIGKIFNTNHTTVISALKKVETNMKKDENFKRIVLGFRRKFELQ
ncbi:MAG: chromosomal replication initiator protein DnaA [Leptospiraceae bacterium]|nr:chromosomal replication initiator protein DnaA [Leptospiraceae bacterium]MCP5512639.1 chromosomal replication initiator protein DnaA [Leptospiraceae bacterium]